MPSFNFTIPDTSPLITYNGSWSDSSHDDSLWNSYANGTFHASPQQGDTATLRFNGSAVYVFGAFRSNHGPYAVTLDGHVNKGDGQSSSSQFEACLYSQTNLDSDKEHELILTNNGSGDENYVDLDYVLVTAGDGDTASPFLDDSGDRAPHIDFSGGWQSVSGGTGVSSTVNQTSIVGSHATITFYGDSIAVYGQTGQSQGDYSASIDGASPRNLSALTNDTRQGELLFWANNLPPTQHTLELTHLTSSKTLSLTSFSTSSWTPAKAGTSTAAIAALVGACASILMLVLLALGWWLWRRRRRFAARAGRGERIKMVRRECEKADLLAGLENTSYDERSRASGTYEAIGTPAPPYKMPPGYEYDEPEYQYHEVSLGDPDGAPAPAAKEEGKRMSKVEERRMSKAQEVAEARRQSRVAAAAQKQARQSRVPRMEEVDVGTIMSADDVLSVRASVASSAGLKEKVGQSRRGRLSVVGGVPP